MRNGDVLSLGKVLHASLELIGHAMFRETLDLLFIQRNFGIDLANLFSQPYEGKVIVPVHYQHLRFAYFVNAMREKCDEGLL